MKRLKIKKFKTILKIINLLIMCGIIVYVPIFAFKLSRDYEIYKEPSSDTKIYTIWHVETFEGGGKSRATFLKTIALEYERSNPGIYFMIKTIQPDTLQAELNLSTPDLISFGHGVGKTVLPYLINIEYSYGIRDDLLNSGSFNGKLYGLAYITSGYAMITHGVQDLTNLLCGTSEYTDANKILAEINVNVTKNQTSYQAYQEFTYNKKTCLIGTGRDVYRVTNLNNIGRLNASISPIDSYTDLIQYLGATNDDLNVQNFVSLALSDKYQSSLAEYALYSSRYNKIYSSGIYNDMENAIFNCEIANVF